MDARQTNEQIFEVVIHSEADEQKSSRFTSKLSEIWNWFVELILRADEPKIYESRDKFGNICWITYDQLAERKMHFNSETEVRAWLDRRYYQ